jgi:hypothetical protein
MVKCSQLGCWNSAPNKTGLCVDCRPLKVQPKSLGIRKLRRVIRLDATRPEA